MRRNIVVLGAVVATLLFVAVASLASIADRTPTAMPAEFPRSRVPAFPTTVDEPPPTTTTIPEPPTTAAPAPVPSSVPVTAKAPTTAKATAATTTSTPAPPVATRTRQPLPVQDPNLRPFNLNPDSSAPGAWTAFGNGCDGLGAVVRITVRERDTSVVLGIDTVQPSATGSWTVGLSDTWAVPVIVEPNCGQMEPPGFKYAPRVIY